jgi:DNA-binding NarL/FixJ family response regulator
MTLGRTGLNMKILVADENSAFRQSLCRFLESHFPGASIKGSNTRGLIGTVREFSPEVIILETGFEYLRKVREQRAGAKIILLTAHDLPEYVEAGRRCGADHVFCKDGVGMAEIQRLLEIISGEAPNPTVSRREYT